MSALASVRKWKDVPSSAPSEWNLKGLSGRLVELSGAEDSAALTFAFGLVRQAQLLGEPVAWLTLVSESFYPPDAAAGGVDVEALAVVRLPDLRALTRAADHLARSGGFGLLVLDVGRGELSMAALSRLLGLAQKHETVVVFLTEKPERAPSLGSLVSLRGQTRWQPLGKDDFCCEMHAVKDKRRAHGWTHREVCGGPAGMH